MDISSQDPNTYYTRFIEFFEKIIREWFIIYCCLSIILLLRVVLKIHLIELIYKILTAFVILLWINNFVVSWPIWSKPPLNTKEQ